MRSCNTAGLISPKKSRAYSGWATLVVGSRTTGLKVETAHSAPPDWMDHGSTTRRNHSFVHSVTRRNGRTPSSSLYFHFEYTPRLLSPFTPLYSTVRPHGVRRRSSQLSPRYDTSWWCISSPLPTPSPLRSHLLRPTAAHPSPRRPARVRIRRRCDAMAIPVEEAIAALSTFSLEVKPPSRPAPLHPLFPAGARSAPRARASRSAARAMRRSLGVFRFRRCEFDGGSLGAGCPAASIEPH